MENYKNKRRKGLGGFPTRAVGCLLALLVLFNSFTAFAYTNSSINDNYSILDMPSTVDLYDEYINTTQTNWIAWLFADYNTNPFSYYLVFMNTMTTADYDYIVSGDKIYTSNFNWDNAQQYGYPYNFTQPYYEQMRVYYFNSGTLGNWQLATNNSNRYYYTMVSTSYNGVDCSFNTADLVLLALHNEDYWSEPSTGDEYMPYFNYSTRQVVYMSVPELKYKFSSSGSVIGSNETEPEEPEEPEYNGLLGQIISWLTQIKNGITDFFTNFSTYLSNGISVIQGWLTNLGTTIGGFFTDLWDNHLSVAFSTVVNWIKAPFEAPDGWVYKIGQKVNTLVVDLITDIKGLFIPDEDFFTDYKADVDEAMQLHFGAVYQTVELTGDLLESVTELFNYEDVDDVQLFFPRLRLDLRELGIYESGSSRYANLIGTHVFWLSDYFPGAFEPIRYQFLDSYNLSFSPLETWYAFVTATLFIYLVYFLKRQLNRILSNSFNVGDE